MDSKSKKKSSILVLSLAAALLFISLAWKTDAQDFTASQSLEVSPPSQEINVDPGKTVEVKAKIRNKSRVEVPFEVRIEDFTASGEEGQVELVPDSEYSVTSWATVTPKTFSLGAGEEREVTARIAVPSNAAGGRYGSFVFTVVNKDKKENTASVAQEIASLFLVRVSGEVNETLHVANISADRFSEFGPIPMTVKLSNSGNIHVKVVGLVNVTDMFGNRTADIVLPATNIFPGADRTIKTSLDKKLLFGRYKAVALLNYGSKNQALTAETTFTVIPVRLIALVLVVLALLYVIRKRLGKAIKTLLK